MTGAEQIQSLDRDDPLAPLRKKFRLPRGIIYLDGNSLGPLPLASQARIESVVRVHWGQDLISSWNKNGWWQLPSRIGDKIARIIGASSGEVTVGDSTSIGIFKLLTAALQMQSTRRVIVSEAENFPTDLYIAEGITRFLAEKNYELRVVRKDELVNAIDENTAVVMLTHVRYSDGFMYNMVKLTSQVQAKGALMLWDLCHSAGAVPLNLNDCHVDLGVGCCYKYLNGGPGAPAFSFIAAKHQDHFHPVLSGWHGHARPFDFSSEYQPAAGIDRINCGTPPILSLAAIEPAIDMFLDIDMNELRIKSLALTDLFIKLIDDFDKDLGVCVITPRCHQERGSQVALTHPEGYAIMQALIESGVIGDFRAPDILRFGFTPLYTRYNDVLQAAQCLQAILENETWREDRFRQRQMVT